MGLTGEQTDKMIQFQDLTGIEDLTICRDVLQRHQWNLEVAVHEQLNIREGRPSMFAIESRPLTVFNDHSAQHIFYSPPSDGSASGLRGIFRSIVNFFMSICYNTVVTLFQIGLRFIRPDEGRCKYCFICLHKLSKKFNFTLNTVKRIPNYLIEYFVDTGYWNLVDHCLFYKYIMFSFIVSKIFLF